MNKLKGKVALITGASGDLGSEIAKEFAKEGVKHLILLSKTTEKLEKLDDELLKFNIKTTLVPIDLKNFNCISQLGEQIIKRFKCLDIFVANAAILGSITPLVHTPLKDWTDVMEINFHSNWHLLKTLEPCLKISKAGRIIFVTCDVAKKITPYWSAYSISKSSLEFMLKLYAAEQEGTSNIKANLINPGLIKTNIAKQAFPGKDPESFRKPNKITKKFIELSLDSCLLNGETIKA